MAFRMYLDRFSRVFLVPVRSRAVAFWKAQDQNHW